ncbi:hypothetical protein BV25DRAFT_1838595 [Artomyces pyxidatus]|uniref:Uncharacterized protein n=1 Tax=Artomyces pyxidatus TaxID=48021 RepID=A0ACB8T1U0_9AGAM|nr:hypothetical protein BV25DRAFT_1838595 [Artomyces pyxidatus]
MTVLAVRTKRMQTGVTSPKASLDGSRYVPVQMHQLHAMITVARGRRENGSTGDSRTDDDYDESAAGTKSPSTKSSIDTEDSSWLWQSIVRSGVGRAGTTAFSVAVASHGLLQRRGASDMTMDHRSSHKRVCHGGVDAFGDQRETEHARWLKL